MGETTQRLFLAIPASDYIKQQLVWVQEQLSQTPEIHNLENLHWTPIEHAHVTVFFIGHVATPLTEQLQEVIAKTTSELTVTTLEFDHLTFAPTGGAARMVWAQYKPNDQYINLVKMFQQALRPFSHNHNENHDIIPHITLARFAPLKTKPLITLPESHLDHLVTSHVQLINSTTTPNGSHYEIIKQYPLSM